MVNAELANQYRQAIWRERPYADAAAVEMEIDRRMLVASGGIDADVTKDGVNNVE